MYRQWPWGFQANLLVLRSIKEENISEIIWLCISNNNESTFQKLSRRKLNTDRLSAGLEYQELFRKRRVSKLWLVLIVSRAVFTWVWNVIHCCLVWQFHYMIGLKTRATFFVQSDVKPKPAVTRWHTFSRASSPLHVITLNFDWFVGLSVFFGIGQSDIFVFFVFFWQSIENHSKGNHWPSKKFLTAMRKYFSREKITENLDNHFCKNQILTHSQSLSPFCGLPSNSLVLFAYFPHRSRLGT